MKNLISLSKRRENISKRLRFISFQKFQFTDNNNSNKVKYVNVNDVKSFGKKFSEEEMKKYLDPYGFLNSTKGIINLLIYKKLS